MVHKMKDRLTIVIPVKDKEETVSKFIEGNKNVLSEYKVIVIDTEGGEELKQYSFIYINDLESKYTMSKARKLGIDLVDTAYIFNLDVDVILPNKYIETLINLLDEDSSIGALSTDYERLQGHLAFGNSIWRTELLKELYDYNNKNKKYCECLYMWGKLNRTKYRLETVDSLRCKHLKEKKI